MGPRPSGVAMYTLLTSINPLYSLSGLAVGLLVGFTGVGGARLAAIGVGFLGVLIATRPGTSAFQPVALLSIAAPAAPSTRSPRAGSPPMTRPRRRCSGRRSSASWS